MPFQNITNDTLWDVWQDGIQNILITNLSNLEELKVRQVEAISDILQGKGLSDYASLTPSVTSSISKYLGANVHITGSIKQSGSIVRLNAQLVNSKTGEAIKSFQINGIPDSILSVIDSLSVMVKNFLAISKIEKEISPDMQYYTNSPEAYKYHILAEKARIIGDVQTAIKYLSKAIAIDSNFVAAMIFLSMRYRDLSQYDDAKKWCLKAYEKRDQVPMYTKLMLEWHYAEWFETPNEEIKYLKQFQDFDLPPVGYFQMGNTYSRLLQYDKAIFYYEKALEIYNKWSSKPLGVFNYTVLGSAYHKTGQYKKEKKIYIKAERDFPDEPSVVYRQAILSLTKGDTVAANRLIKKYISICRNQSMTEVTLQLNLGYIYEEAGILDKAELIYRQLISSAAGGPNRFYRLARLLIDKDRNITEGLELIDKALVIRPDNYDFLDIKGLGLYKQGKYQEAFEILQKSWDLRRQNAVYNHEAFLHLEAAKKAVSGMR
jgi:tetratricopeptide (TPR) repeat protein